MKNEILQFIKLSQIIDSPWQGRLLNINFLDEDSPDVIEVKKLAKSIEENGLMQPITVRPVDDKFEIIDGHRRVMAYKLLGRGDIKAIIKPYTEKEAQLFSLIGNLQRKNLNPIEQAVAFQKVLDSGLYNDKKELSAAIGKDETYIGDVLNTLNMDKRIVDDQSKTNAIKDVRMLRLIRKVEPVDEEQISYKQWALYQKVVEEKMTRVHLQKIME